MMKLVHFTLYVYLLLTINAGALSAQIQSQNRSSEILEKNLYESLKLEIEFLISSNSPVDSVIILLFDDAKKSAREQDWLNAIEILSSIQYFFTSIIQDPSQSIQFEISRDNSTNSQPVNFPNKVLEGEFFKGFQMETGIDYSLQEFEMTFLENDSTIIEELQSPYFGLVFTHNFPLKRHSISFNHRLRYDNQFFYYNVLASIVTGSRYSQSKFELEGYYFHQSSTLFSDFLDGQIRYSLNKVFDANRSLNLNLRGRYKGFIQPDSLNANVLNAALNLGLDMFINSQSNISLFVTPEIYREIQSLGLSYFQTVSGFFYRFKNGPKNSFELGLEAFFRDYKDDLGGEEYKNHFLSFGPRFQGELSFSRRFGVALMTGLENRTYKTPDEVNPDFLFASLESFLKLYWGNLNSFGIGYYGDIQNNRVEDPSYEPLVEQENFYSNGMIFNMELMNFSGLMLSVRYRIFFRTYPDAIDSPLYTYYSDRFVHSVNALGWVPVGKRLQFQIFANYDNDQDRDNEQNDNRSTILNLGLIYKF